MSIWLLRDQRQVVQAYVVAETPTREWRRDLRDSLSPTHRSDAAHTTRSMRTYLGRYSSGHDTQGTASGERGQEHGLVLAII